MSRSILFPCKSLCQRPGMRLRLPAVLGFLATGCSVPETRVEHDRIPLTLTEIFTASGGAGRAVLSPDGETIAVSGPAPGGGSGIHLLTGTSGADGPPTFRTSGGSQVWSPDGKLLAYIAGAHSTSRLPERRAGRSSRESRAFGRPPGPRTAGPLRTTPGSPAIRTSGLSPPMESRRPCR